MKAGDKVLHKLTGQSMTVISVSESVARLKKDIPEPFILGGIKYHGDTAVCHVDNLVKIGDEGYIWYREGNGDKCTCDVFIMNIVDNKLKLAYDADFEYPLYRLYDLKDVTVINYKNYKL